MYNEIFNEDNIEFAKDIISDLIRSEEFIELINDEYINENYYTDVFSHFNYCHDSEIAFGCNKMCVIPNDTKWVIKFDYTETDSSRRECEIYNSAIENGLEKFFCPIMHVYNYYIEDREIEFFISQKAFINYEYNMNYLSRWGDEYYNEDWEFYSNLHDNHFELKSKKDYIEDLIFNIESSDLIEALYIKERASIKNKLYNFILSNKINDLHAGNWGILDGEMIFTDYSGTR